ncbi:MAG: hypothetical protein ABJH72_03945 [Reichenbachiella sp.]|uniref:hypothetical protein n=1 Tax=Reichenbachiella sp. TaxID=2184521 RepID=UPI0032982EA3
MDFIKIRKYTIRVEHISIYYNDQFKGNDGLRVSLSGGHSIFIKDLTEDEFKKLLTRISLWEEGGSSRTPFSGGANVKQVTIHEN